MTPTIPRLHWVLAVCVGCLALAWTAPGAERKRIVLVAGQKSHGPEGNRIHDYPWSIRLLKAMLEHSNIRDQVDVSLHFNGWPNDPAALEDAATLMIVSDGRDGEIGREAPHLADASRLEAVQRLMDRGGGIIVFHFSTFAPDRLADTVLDWYGGYFDWETEGRREWYSDITTVEARVDPASPGHPVLNGVEPFRLREEFYFDIRFRPGDPRWRPIWKVEDLPATHPHGNVVSWTVERDDGGRGFATTCGHFYDNWKETNFRKTLLNAIAWTARIPVPESGVEADFFDRSAIEAHLREPGVVETESVTADETVYAEEPYWYKPGHPLEPAESASIETLSGFQAERVLAVPREFGSWTALTVDDKGRLIAAAQHRPGLYRVTVAAGVPPAGDGGILPPVGPSRRDASSPAGETPAVTLTKVEPLSGVAATVGWSHGLLHAFGGLYVTVSEKNDQRPPGVYRLRDTDGDDQYDEIQPMARFDASGEHGPHNIVPGPDGQSLYMIGGNGTKLPEGVDLRMPAATEGIDHLLPPGFESSRHTVAGWVCRFDPDGKNWTLVASGLRNSFDLAFNRTGDLFTFDSDMEWDLGTPWYRPTRICHVPGGAEFGWRGDAAKWPEYYEDSVAPVVNVGPASPTGVAFGYGARFPERYREALFACDWTFATIHAVHLVPQGASYRAEVEEFAGGRGLPITDLAVGRDGALYFIVGGRRLGSALYRIRYIGDENTVAPGTKEERAAASSPIRELRLRLESFHGRRDPSAVAKAWPHLGHADRFIRFAARVAVESQPVQTWRERALAESEPSVSLAALLALARQGNSADQRDVIDRLLRQDFSSLSEDRKLRALRVYELALARGEDEIDDRLGSARRALRVAWSGEDSPVNRELARLLCYLRDASMIDPLLDLMAADAGDRPELGTGYFTRNAKYGVAVRDMLQSAPRVAAMHYAQMLLWLDDGWTPGQRRRYFQLVADAMRHSKGGHTYRDHWNRIREAALEQMPEGQREGYEALVAEAAAPSWGVELPAARGPGRAWTMDEALEAVGNGLAARDFENGRRTFAAAGCVVCHRVAGQGGAVGPDLSTLGQRFTVRDILQATIHPSDAISDQYQLTILELKDGKTISGRVVSQDEEGTRLATDLMKPGQSVVVPEDSIRGRHRVPVSTMPTGLLDALNREELLDLLGYLAAGGLEGHRVFRP